MAAKNNTAKSAPNAELIDAVKAHAADNYEAGWDVVVETMDDDDIAARIGRARTAKGAIARVAELVEAQTERRIDVLGQSGEHDEEVAALVAAAPKAKRAKKSPAAAPTKAATPSYDDRTAEMDAHLAETTRAKPAKTLWAPKSGAALKAAVKAAGTSYRKIGAEQGVNPHTINRLVTAKQAGVPADVAARIAQGVSLAVDDLFFPFTR